MVYFNYVCNWNNCWDKYHNIFISNKNKSLKFSFPFSRNIIMQQNTYYIIDIFKHEWYIELRSKLSLIQEYL